MRFAGIFLSLKIFILVDFVIISKASYADILVNHDTDYKAPSTPETEGYSAQAVARTSTRKSNSSPRATEANFSDPATASFQRSRVSAPDHISNGLSTTGASWLDVRQLQKVACEKCVVLRSMWVALGGLHRLSPEEEADDQIDLKAYMLDGARSCTMGQCTRWQKPKAEPEESATQETEGTRQGERQAQAGCAAPTDSCTASTSASWRSRGGLLG